MVDYVFYGKCFGGLGALHTWLWWMEINVRNDVQFMHVVLTLNRGRHLHYTRVVLVALVSIASVFLNLWKDSGAR
jgi:hypothetical protein